MNWVSPFAAMLIAAAAQSAQAVGFPEDTVLLVRKVTYSAEGVVVSRQEYGYTRDAMDWLHETQRYFDSGGSHGNTLETARDAGGRVRRTALRYVGQSSELRLEMHYGANGLVERTVSSVVADTGFIQGFVQYHEHDAQGNPVKIWFETNSPFSIGPIRYRNEYDAQGRLVFVETFSNDTLSSTVRYAYDDLGRVKETRSTGSVYHILHSYDAEGNRSVDTYLGSDGVPVGRTHYEYASLRVPLGIRPGIAVWTPKAGRGEFDILGRRNDAGWNRSIRNRFQTGKWR